MAKKAHLIKAGVLNAASVEKSASFYVYASLEPKVDTKAELAAFKCPSCNTGFSALAKTQPYCVTCGFEDVELDEGTDALEAEDFGDGEEMADVECADCGTHNIVTVATAGLMGTQIHCVTCGSTINYHEITAEAEDGESDEDYTVVDDLDELADSEGEGENELTETEEIVDETPDAEDEKPEEAAADEVVEDDVPAEDAEPAVEEPSEEDVEDAEDTEEDFNDFEEASLVSMVEGELTLAHVEDVLVASVAGLPVATLEHAAAKEHGNHFYATQFASAIKHTVRQLGVEKGLANYGFTFASVRVPMSAIVAKRVEAKAAEAAADYTARIEALTEDMQQAQTIAMAALNKGFFRGKANPLKIAFADELTVAGVRNAGKLVDKVFAACGDNYSKAVFELANELLSKSVEHRNEIAASVVDMTYQSANADEEENTDEDDFEAKLEGAGLRSKGVTAKLVKKTETASDLSVGAIDRLRSLNNGRLF